MSARSIRAAIYARVSTLDQSTENQLIELRAYAERRGWSCTEYVDQGVSGAKEQRPALDELVLAARRRRFDVVVCWRLDRLGRNLRHLITLLEELQSLNVDFVSLNEGIDATTPSGRLQMHILGAMAEFERARIGERVRIGLARVRNGGQKLGRPSVVVNDQQLADCKGLPAKQAAKALGISLATLYRRRSAGASQKPADGVLGLRQKTGAKRPG